MRLPSFKRLLKSDYEPQYQKLVETLSYSINYGIEAIYNALSNNITLTDNIKCTVKDITVKVDASGTPTVTTTFPVTFTGAIQGLMVINAVNQTNSNTYPTGGVFVSFSQVQTGIVITNITGLQPNDSYTIRLVIFG